VKLPGIGSIGGLSGRYNETNLYYSFGSMTNPGDFYKVDISHDKELTSKEIRSVDVPNYVEEDYLFDRVFYPSNDGTEIPMFIVRHKDVLPTLDFKPEKPIPTLMYVYGGFGIVNDMHFSMSREIWMKNFKGMFVAVSLRGGGDYGEEWHEMGKGFNR
jgi:prolyl oligopeptidase